VTVADKRRLPLPASLIPLKKTKTSGFMGVLGFRFAPMSCTVRSITVSEDSRTMGSRKYHKARSVCTYEYVPQPCHWIVLGEQSSKLLVHW